MTDPRFTDPRLSDPMIRRDEWTSGRDENIGGMWSWVAGVLLLLLGFLIFAGWNSNSNTANSGSSPSTTTASRTVTPPSTGSSPSTTTASRTVTPPSTTGSGSSSPQPIIPAPSTPAPPKSGTQ